MCVCVYLCGGGEREGGIAHYAKHIETLKIISFNATYPNKRNHPGKFDTKTLTQKTRKANSH